MATHKYPVDSGTAPEGNPKKERREEPVNKDGSAEDEDKND